jgi:hypothetical protein
MALASLAAVIAVVAAAHLTCFTDNCCCSYPFEIHDDALVLRKMLEHDNMQKLTGGARPLCVHFVAFGADTVH